MKPHSHTGQLTVSVGAPWEIYRLGCAGRVIDLYTKDGSLPGYNTFFALSPDNNFDFSVLATGPDDSNAVLLLTALVVENFIPAFETRARAGAQADLTGLYAASGGLNSSLLLATDGNPGLNVVTWISNGSDVLAAIAQVNGGTPGARLYPTGVGSLKDPAGLAFRAVFAIPPSQAPPGNVSYPDVACQSWGGVDNPTYGSGALDEIVFRLDGQSGAVVARSPALRADMSRVK